MENKLYVKEWQRLDVLNHDNLWIRFLGWIRIDKLLNTGPHLDCDQVIVQFNYNGFKCRRI